jgi:hypothetical protein
LFLYSQEVGDVQRVALILNSFCKAQPHRDDVELSVSWLAMIGAGYVRMAQLDETMCMKKLPSVVQAVMEMLLSNQKEVRTAVASTLNSLIRNSISQKSVNITANAVLVFQESRNRPSTKTLLEQVIGTILKGFAYKYRESWDVVLALVMLLFERLGVHADPIMKDAVDLLGNLYKYQSFHSKTK